MSTTKTTAPTKLLTLIDGDLEMIIATGEDVEMILASSMRAPSQYGLLASHRTKLTRKYQVMAAIPYENCLKVLVAKNDLPSEAAATRIVMEAGLRALGFGKVVDAFHDDDGSDGEGGLDGQ